jgi:hypothetical protein
VATSGSCSPSINEVSVASRITHINFSSPPVVDCACAPCSPFQLLPPPKSVENSFKSATRCCSSDRVLAARPRFHKATSRQFNLTRHPLTASHLQVTTALPDICIRAENNSATEGCLALLTTEFRSRRSSFPYNECIVVLCPPFANTRDHELMRALAGTM